MVDTVSIPGRHRSLGLDEQGELWLKADSEGFRPISFNKLYEGYYPGCRFTAIAATKKGFVAASMDTSGRPMLFHSLLGGVWERINLVCREGVPSGEILRILVLENPEQLFLCCDNGELITVPDCPHCLRLRRVTDQQVTEAVLDGDSIQMTLYNCQKLFIPLRKLSQLRAHPDYAFNALKDGAALVDVGSTPGSPYVQSWAKPLLALASRIDPEALEDWLNVQKKDRKLFFMCNYGVQAELAARTARRLGYPQAYFLSGVCLPDQRKE